MKAFYFFVGTWCLCFAGITAIFVAREQDVSVTGRGTAASGSIAALSAGHSGNNTGQYG